RDRQKAAVTGFCRAIKNILILINRNLCYNYYVLGYQPLNKIYFLYKRRFPPPKRAIPDCSFFNVAILPHYIVAILPHLHFILIYE
ncbi:hypothetical protein, partial [Amedibacterium intestinale]|uniref:hypothetical protein n=1 Tax=Amedibacterium intestinale TaxID=2583452 RepID=UPI0022E821DD